MGLTSEQSLIEVQKLYDMLFDANAMFDRMFFVLNIKYNMNSFSDYFHQRIAHLVAGDKFADSIGNVAVMCGDELYRGAIPTHKENYDKVSDAMKMFTLKIGELQKQCVHTLKICAKNDDEVFEDYLRTFNQTNLTILLKQATVFYNATVDYERGNNIYKFNKDYSVFITNEFKNMLGD